VPPARRPPWLSGTRHRPALGRFDAARLGRPIISHPISSHGLRRTFCTTGLVAGIGTRDMQYATRHADPRTTLRHDMAKTTSTTTPLRPSPPTSLA
jgi:integrase